MNYFKLLLFSSLIFIFFGCSKKSLSEESNPFYDKAFDFFYSIHQDSAYIYFDKAKDEFSKSNNKFKQGKCLVFMAIISSNKGDYQASQDLSIEAIKHFNENDINQFEDIHSNYNNLGIASNNLKEYENAIRFYNNALKFTDKADSKLATLNNVASVYKDKKDYKNAIFIYNQILNNDQKPNDSIYSTVLTSLAISKWLANKNYNPEPELLKSLKIKERQNNLLGENASYYYLSDYYSDKNPDKALQYAKKMFTVSNKLNSADDQLQALYKLVELDTKNYKMFFKRYSFLQDSLQTDRNNSKNKFAIIRFDVERYKKQNAEKENDLLVQYILAGVLFSIIIIVLIIYRKRQSRLKQEKELEVKNTQLRLSKKVHDVVANGIYQVMTKIENQEHFDRDTALDELEFVYEKSRDISYDKADEEQEFSKKVSELIASFNNDTVKTFTAGNNPALWENISPPVKDEVFQIIRELMVNMKKHSQASHVALRFEKTETSIEIQYKDNGIGIPGDLIYKNGLRNAESRMAAIGGAIIFDTEIEKGLKVNLSIPAS